MSHSPDVGRQWVIVGSGSGKGFQASCGCGWKSPVYGDSKRGRSEARKAAADHVARPEELSFGRARRLMREAGLIR